MTRERACVTLTGVKSPPRQQRSLRLEPSVWETLDRIAREHYERFGVAASAADAVTMLVREWERREAQGAGSDDR